jgi:serine/threonine protein kinase
VNLTNRSMLPFRHVEHLGKGGSAMVEVVENETTGTKFAHKALSPRHGSNPEKVKQAFQNEIDIIKRLYFQPHIIQIYWSYICDNTFGMLLTPIASDGDLQAYLETIKNTKEPLTSEQSSVLGRSFGCLASGLAFIHSKKIRHKDIKPQNILVHEGQMIITDFGIALDASGQDTTTTGIAEAFTDRYRAPEVARYEPRNRLSDVFSLGCVFLVIMASLAPGADVGISNPRPYWVRVDDVQDNLVRLSNSDASLREMCLIFSSMLQERRSDRVKAEAVLHRIRTIKESQLEPAYELICRACTISTSTTSQETMEERIVISDNTLWPSHEGEHKQFQNGPTFFRREGYGKHRTTQDALKVVANGPLSRRERREGYIYIFRHPLNPDFIRIGWTGDVPRRLREWSQHCKYPIVEHDQVEKVFVQNPPFVEMLTMTHLRDVQFTEDCTGCHMRHYQWFFTTPEDAVRIVKKYSNWTAKAPYEPFDSL